MFASFGSERCFSHRLYSLPDSVVYQDLFRLDRKISFPSHLYLGSVRMLQTAIDQRSKLTMNIRPLKIAYFLRDRDVEGLERIIRLACTQWGGQRHVLVPVAEDLLIPPVFEHFLQVNEPDEFVSFVSASTGEIGHSRPAVEVIQNQVQRMFPARGPITIKHGAAFETSDESIHTLHMFTLEDTTRDLPSYPVLSRIRKTRAPLPDFKLSPVPFRDLIQLGLYGGIYLGQEDSYAKMFNVQALTTDAGSEFFWSTQLNVDPFSSILNLTTYGLRPHLAHTNQMREGNYFDVVFVNSVASLCLYWNLRALREATQFTQDLKRRTILLPEDLLNDPSQAATFVAFVRRYLPYPGLRPQPHLWFHVADEPSRLQLGEVLSYIGDLQELDGSAPVGTNWSWNRFEPPELEDLTTEKVTYRCVETSSALVRRFLPLSYREGFGRWPLSMLVELSEGRNEVKHDTPPGFRNQSLGILVVDLESDIWARYPKAHNVAEAIKQGGWFSKYGISMRMRCPARPTYLSFDLPSEWVALSRYFEGKGYFVRPSKAGQYGAAIVRLMGGIRAVDILAQKLVYLLLDMLALRSTKKVAQRIVEAIGRNDLLVAEVEEVLQELEVIPELQGIPKTYQQLTSDERLKPYHDDLLACISRLSENQILKRGFYLECPNCGARDWYPLETLREQLACGGCSHVFMLPVEQPPGSEIRWQYRLNTLVNRAVDQDVLPAILALHYLTKDRIATCLALGIEIMQEKQSLTDLDFVFVSEQQLFGGECKAGTELGEKDFKTAQLAADLGFIEFSFCTVNVFSADTTKRVEEFRTQLEEHGISMKISMLSGTELLGEAIS